MLSATCKPYMLSVMAPDSSATKRKKVLQPRQQTESGTVNWEDIRILNNTDEINRRLLVPYKIVSFEKFDDVILAKVDSDKKGKPSVFRLQRLGREAATK
jgi:hypothetical protein